MPELALETRGLSKSFGNSMALRQVDLRIRAGEVHGLMGQNGSGKSTLIKVLAGFHAPDPGATIQIHGSTVALPITRDSLRTHAIGFVHQDLGLLPGLSILDNFMVSVWARQRQGMTRISWRAARERAQASLARYGLGVDVREPVEQLDRAQRALLALARAMDEITSAANRGTILVLDEITAFLSRAEAEVLYQAVRAIAKSGGTVLIVSHDIEEVLGLCDALTVLRDGEIVERLPGSSSASNSARLIEAITGTSAASGDPDLTKGNATSLNATRSSANVAEVSGLVAGRVRHLDLTLRAGEIVGVTGLRGSGFELIPYLLFGILKFQQGLVRYGKASFRPNSLNPQRAVAAGVGLVPADRLDRGCAAALTVAQNVSLQVLHRFVRGTRLQHPQVRSKSATILRRYLVRPPEPALKVGALSGGNQQKVLLAKWMWPEPKLLLLHQPTQGVDVGARHEILQMLRSAASRGLAILCADEDSEVLASFCDRVLIFADGQCRAELSGDALTKERIDIECIDQRPNRRESV